MLSLSFFYELLKTWYYTTQTVPISEYAVYSIYWGLWAQCSCLLDGRDCLHPSIKHGDIWKLFITFLENIIYVSYFI